LDQRCWILLLQSLHWQQHVHIYLVDFYIVRRDRDNGVKTYELLSPNDILYLGPTQKVWALIRFGPHKGDYMMRAFSVIGAHPFIINGFANIIYSN